MVNEHFKDKGPTFNIVPDIREQHDWCQLHWKVSALKPETWAVEVSVMPQFPVQWDIRCF